MDSGSDQVSTGLVLSAGGAAAEAWHAGVLRATQEATGWDARCADLVVGTSAGAITALCVRAGLSPSDLYARHRGDPLSDEGQALLDRIVTPYSEGRRDRGGVEHGPQAPALAARALWPPWQARPLHAAVAMMPRGTRTTEVLEQRLSELHPEPWPKQRMWLTAVRLSDGERVVFGRDDIDVSAAAAVRASCAVPARYEPVELDGERYVDGGLHSYSNADLMGPPAFDVVLVSSVMSGEPGWSQVRGSLETAWVATLGGLGLGERRSPAGQGDPAPQDKPAGNTNRAWWSKALGEAWSDGRALRAARRQWVDDKLRAEVDGLRRRDIAVLVVEPDPDGVELIDAATSGHEAEGDDSRLGLIAALAYRTAQRRLSEASAARIADRLMRAGG